MPIEAKFACNGFAGMPCPDEMMYTVTAYGTKHPSSQQVFGIILGRGWENTDKGMWRCPECVQTNQFYQYALASALRHAASFVADSNEATFDEMVLLVSAKLEEKIATWDEIKWERHKS